MLAMYSSTLSYVPAVAPLAHTTRTAAPVMETCVDALLEPPHGCRIQWKAAHHTKTPMHSWTDSVCAFLPVALRSAGWMTSRR
jgi:hypothetical protein